MPYLIAEPIEVVISEHQGQFLNRMLGNSRYGVVNIEPRAERLPLNGEQ
jgi:hypothetical protein